MLFLTSFTTSRIRITCIIVISLYGFLKYASHIRRCEWSRIGILTWNETNYSFRYNFYIFIYILDNISHDINLDVPDTSKLQPIPSEAETNVTIPEATPTPSKKRKFILAGNTSEKKETHLNTLTNRLVNRKNFKDETDAKVFNKKK